MTNYRERNKIWWINNQFSFSMVPLASIGTRIIIGAPIHSTLFPEYLICIFSLYDWLMFLWKIPINFPIIFLLSLWDACDVLLLSLIISRLFPLQFHNNLPVASWLEPLPFSDQCTNYLTFIPFDFIFISRLLPDYFPYFPMTSSGFHTIALLMLPRGSLFWSLCFPESVWAKGSYNSGGLYNIFSSSHLPIFTSTYIIFSVFSSSHFPIFTSTHISSSHLHIFPSSHLRISSSHLISSRIRIFSSSHLHILRISSSHPHIFSSSHLCTYT